MPCLLAPTSSCGASQAVAFVWHNSVAGNRTSRPPTHPPTHPSNPNTSPVEQQSKRLQLGGVAAQRVPSVAHSRGQAPASQGHVQRLQGDVPGQGQLPRQRAPAGHQGSGGVEQGEQQGRPAHGAALPGPRLVPHVQRAVHEAEARLRGWGHPVYGQLTADSTQVQPHCAASRHGKVRRALPAALTSSTTAVRWRS